MRILQIILVYVFLSLKDFLSSLIYKGLQALVKIFRFAFLAVFSVFVP